MTRDKPPSARPEARRAYRAANLETLRRKDRDRYRANPALILWSKAKQRARLKGLEFTLAREDVIIPENCPVFGFKLEQGTKAEHKRAPTLDRIDPKKGYIPGNVMVISWQANRMKQDATAEELRMFAQFFLNLADDPRA